MEHVNGWCFRGIYKGGLWEDDLHVSAQKALFFVVPRLSYLVILYYPYTWSYFIIHSHNYFFLFMNIANVT